MYIYTQVDVGVNVDLAFLLQQNAFMYLSKDLWELLKYC